MKWRHFRFGEIEEALRWAAEGNIAVHDTGVPYRRWKRTCHLFAKDEEALRAAARKVKCHQKWIQQKESRGRFSGYYLTHYDIFGKPLEDALKLCADAE